MRYYENGRQIDDPDMGDGFGWHAEEIRTTGGPTLESMDAVNSAQVKKMIDETKDYKDILNEYFKDDKTINKDELDACLKILSNHSILLDDTINLCVTEILKYENNLLKNNLDLSSSTDCILSIMKLYDKLFDILTRLKRNGYSFGGRDEYGALKAASGVDIYSIKTKLEGQEEILRKISQIYKVPITFAISNSDNLFDCKRGEYRVMLNNYFDYLSGNRVNWNDCVFGKYYNPNSKNWYRMLGGIDENGNKVEMPETTAELVSKMVNLGYNVPKIENGKFVYDEKRNDNLTR